MLNTHNGLRAFLSSHGNTIYAVCADFRGIFVCIVDLRELHLHSAFSWTIIVFDRLYYPNALTGVCPALLLDVGS